MLINFFPLFLLKSYELYYPEPGQESGEPSRERNILERATGDMDAFFLAIQLSASTHKTNYSTFKWRVGLLHSISR